MFTPEAARNAGKKSSRKGIPNRSSAELKAVVCSIVNRSTSKLETALETMHQNNPEAYVQAIVKLLPFVIAKEAPEVNEEKHKATWPTSFVFQVTKDVELSEEQQQPTWPNS
jgi:hypothetical protein